MSEAKDICVNDIITNIAETNIMNSCRPEQSTATPLIISYMDIKNRIYRSLVSLKAQRQN